MIDTPFGSSKNIKVELIPEQVSISEHSEQVFRPIYYTYNRFDLETTYKERLDVIVDYLNENIEAEVEVSSFADCRGPRAYNLKLTEKRSKTFKLAHVYFNPTDLCRFYIFKIVLFP